MNNKKFLEKKIQEKELQIKKLHLHQSDSDVCVQLLNKLILDKAILKKELDNSKSNRLFNFLNHFIPKKQKLISDYFNE